MSLSNIAGLTILIIAFSIIVGMTVYTVGAYVALLTWAAALTLTAMIVLGVWLIT